MNQIKCQWQHSNPNLLVLPDLGLPAELAVVTPVKFLLNKSPVFPEKILGLL